MIEAFTNPIVLMALAFGGSIGGMGLLALWYSNRQIAREERRLRGQ